MGAGSAVCGGERWLAGRQAASRGRDELTGTWRGENVFCYMRLAELTVTCVCGPVLVRQRDAAACRLESGPPRPSLDMIAKTSLRMRQSLLQQLLQLPLRTRPPSGERVLRRCRRLVSHTPVSDSSLQPHCPLDRATKRRALGC